MSYHSTVGISTTLIDTRVDAFTIFAGFVTGAFAVDGTLGATVWRIAKEIDLATTDCL